MSRILAALLLAASAGLAHAQAWPSHALKMVVPFPPGGGTDLTARSVAAKLAEALGQPVVVENRGGAGGTIGSDAVAKAAPDGYTIGIATSSTHPGALVLQKNVPYDPLKSFAPITMIGSTSFVLLGSPALPANSIAEMVAYAKANPGKLSMASAGVGTSQHMSIELLKSMGGVDITHIPYKGGAPALSDLLGGQIPSLLTGMPAGLGAVRSGRVRALGVTSAKRSPHLPDVPAIAETVPGYEVTSWAGVCAPAGVPKAIIAKLNADIVKVLGMADTRQKLDDQGFEAAPNTPEQFTAFIAAELSKWASVIKAAGIQAE